MPVLKITHGGSSRKMIHYLLTQDREGNRLQALGGTVVGRDPQTVEAEFRETRLHFGDGTGRQYYHVAISFERTDLGDLATPEGKPDYTKLRDYGEQWAQEAGIAKDHE